jgi:NADH-quinone oxidoreductase subunit N
MITTFMATFVKTVAFAGFYRLFFLTFMPVRAEYALLFAVIAALTMLVSNLIASAQSNVKRLLAYSSISHAGFMVITLLCMNSSSAGTLLYYTLVYSISSIIAFSIFKWVKTHSAENEEISAFTGLIRRSPFLAVVMTFALLSMSGIPPLSGFMAKYMVFTAAIDNGFMWVAICGIAGSLMAVYYYFKIIIAMFAEVHESSEIKVPANLRFVLIVCSIALLALMLFPSQISCLI